LAIILYIKKKYGWINLKAEPNFQAISQKNSVLVHQFSSLIFNNTDILILTFFCDLNQVSIYTLYKYLFGFAITVINLLSSSVNFRLGQLFSKREHFLKLYDMYEVFHIALTFSLLTLVYLYITPFLRLYTAGMDIEYIVPFLPLTFCVMEYLNSIRTPTNNVIVYAGKFKETQWRSLTEALINLTVSLVAVHFLGINGVVLGTVAALLYRSNDVILFANRRVLGRSAWHTYRTILVNVILSVATVLVYTWIDMEFTGYVTFVVSGFVSVLICVPLYLAVSYLLYPSVGKSFVVYVGDILKKRRKKR
jgi:O-antigen/teichoic acid export membrane protein